MKLDLVIIVPELNVVWNLKESQLVLVAGLISIFCNYIEKREEKKIKHVPSVALCAF